MIKNLPTLKTKFSLFTLLLLTCIHLQVNAQAPSCSAGTIQIVSPSTSIIHCPGMSPGTIMNATSPSYSSTPPTPASAVYIFWQANDGTGWADVASGTLDTPILNYSPGPLMVTTSFRRMIASPTVPCGPIYSNVVTISVRVNAGIISTSTPNVCPGGTAQFTNVESGWTTMATYGWELFVASSNSWVDQGVTTTTFSKNVTGLPSPSQFRRRVVALGCTAYSNIVTLNIATTPFGGTISTSTPNICLSNGVAQLNNVTSGTPGTYQWQTFIAGYNGGTWVDHGVTTPNFTASPSSPSGFALFTPTTSFRRALIPSCGGGGPRVYSNTIVINANSGCRMVTTEESVSEDGTSAYFLDQNAPNPASSFTEINYHFPESSKEANIQVRDVFGKGLAQHKLTNHKGSIKIITEEIPSGVYLYSLVANGKVMKTKKMLVVK